jgi:D-psicose/D-tagatose/L-ribulose 3-epimerase
MTAIKFGASTFIWTSPFSNDTLDLIDKVAGAGFDLIEICVEDPATINTKAINKRLLHTGIGALVCGAFGPDRDVSSDDPSIRANGIDYINICSDIAAELGAPAVAGPMYSATGKTAAVSAEKRAEQWKWASENLAFSADHAATQHVSLAIEPLNRFETDLINTVDQGMELVRRIGRDNVGLLLDTFHMNIEEHSIPNAIRRAAGKIFHFHSCANDRGIPGKDHLPWPEIVNSLSDAGYTGPWVIEAFNPEIKEIAKAVSLWRPLAVNKDAIAYDGLKLMKSVTSDAITGDKII